MAYTFAAYANRVWPNATGADAVVREDGLRGRVGRRALGRPPAGRPQRKVDAERLDAWRKWSAWRRSCWSGLTCTAPQTSPAAPVKVNLPGAMIFVLFAFGGWNEMAYVGAEVKEPRKNILRALLVGTLAVTAIYVLVTLAFVHAVGLAGARQETVAADVLSLVNGRWAGPGNQLVDLRFRSGRGQRPDFHRRADLLRHGRRPSALRLAGPLERPPRHARPLAAGSGGRSRWC